MKKYFFFLFVIIGSVHAQDQMALYDSIVKYQFNNSELAKHYSFELLKLSKENKLINGECNAYFHLADIYSAMEQKDSTLYYYDKAIQKAEEKGRYNLVLIYKINKANYFFCQFDYEASLVTYNESLELAKSNNNESLYEYVLFKRGRIDYELEKYSQALEVFKKSSKVKSFEPAIGLEVQLSIARTYIKLKQPEQALVYIDSGIRNSRIHKHVVFGINFRVEKGIYLIAKKKFSEAEKVFAEAESMVTQTNDQDIIYHVLLNKSKLYLLEDRKKEAIATLEGLLKKNNADTIPVEYLVEIYYLLAESYRLTDNAVSSNEYYQKYIAESKKIGKKKIDTIDYLHSMDVSEIESQKASLVMQKWFLITAFSVLGVFVIFLYFRKRRNDRENQSKFESLIRRIDEYEAERNAEKESYTEDQEHHIAKNTITYIEVGGNEPVFTENESDTDSVTADEESEGLEEFNENHANETSSGFIIKDETVNEILEGLVKLEEKKYFLKQECTLHTVAKKLKTNTAYLSKIVNNELGKSFSTYINELRINYVIVELKNNARLRSYSVNAIAVEIGYKRPDAFTRYFKEATGITPTIYIKKINQHMENTK
ncbi:helix-turn-helix domain-containing protein [Flavobacterium amniphilum]|uniref:helix-turn-helix domain-containing protein n=1 Tax=Flavobacterium amniphilum TaxID=1834035 RepID=UPI002029FE2E|nr:helix-turn-helix domain-containing protein [Flavobacterium amniphilum]MCL9807391.1 helix-turn-helix domain-containing protein [Flavobacterium amniphilum]